MKREKFKIDRGIPIPITLRRYPFDEMKIGDSFLIPGEQCDAPENKKRENSVHKSLRHYNKFSMESIAITTRAVNSERLGYGIRVWRIK